MNISTISEKKNVVLTRGMQRRLVNDIKDIIKNPLTDHGIYYVHDEVDILKGYALIIGPSDTIYENGFYFFEFHFPQDYPFSPPKLVFRTSGDNIRFHPNLYRNGKVCLSIINTWKGEGWTSCQTIQSILLILVTLFHNKSLLNEPGVTEKHRDFKNYHKIIEYKNYDIAVNSILLQKNFPPTFIPFFHIIKKHFLDKYDCIIKKIEKKSKKMICLTTGIYNLRDICIDYVSLETKISRTYNLLKN